MASNTPSSPGSPKHGAAATAVPEEGLVFYRPENYQAQESVGYLMKRIMATVAAEVERELSPGCLTNAQWGPMFKLYLGEASTVAELARVCELDAGAMTRLLDRLEAKGHVRRSRSESDRRVVNIELTEEGREAARRIPEVLSRVQNAYLKGFSVEEWELLKSLLRRVLANAQAGVLGSPPDTNRTEEGSQP